MSRPSKPPVHASVGKRVRWARLQSGYTLDGLAQVMGTTRQTIIRWEKGHYIPNGPSRRKLAAATGQEASFFADSPAAAEDDEEADPAVVLLNAVRALVRAERKGEARAKPLWGEAR